MWISQSACTCACMPLKYRWCILVTLTSRQHFTLGLYTLKKVLCQCDQSAHQCITTTRHDASKVLSHLHELNPSATVLRIVCDGPTTQYRSKKNFFNLSTIPFQLGFQTITWNSWCLDMGKVLGMDRCSCEEKSRFHICKRKGPNGQVFYEELSKEQPNVKLVYVTEREIWENGSPATRLSREDPWNNENTPGNIDNVKPIDL